MKHRLWAVLRDARYALPGVIEKHVVGPDAAAANRICERLLRNRQAATVGYFQAAGISADDIVGANLSFAARLREAGGDALISVKAPPLGFDESRMAAIAEAAEAAGTSLMFDSHAPRDAERTIEAVERLLPAYPATGLAIPARWSRSTADALRLRESTARIRIVKGEWPDPEWNGGDIECAYLALVSSLAGRKGTVAVATHKPELAERALAILLAAGTHCELEQLRGLPGRRTTAVARRLGVPVRVYVPFGPGWWPYVADKALARPYLPLWFMRDLIGMRDRAG